MDGAIRTWRNFYVTPEVPSVIIEPNFLLSCLWSRLTRSSANTSLHSLLGSGAGNLDINCVCELTVCILPFLVFEGWGCTYI